MRPHETAQIETTTTQWYEPNALRLINGDVADWFDGSVTSFEREMAARALTLHFFPNVQGRGLDTMGQRMMRCLDNEALQHPPSTRITAMAGDCAIILAA